MARRYFLPVGWALHVPPAEIGGRSQGVCVAAHAVADVPGNGAAIAQGQADHAIGHAGQEEDRGQDLAPSAVSSTSSSCLTPIVLAVFSLITAALSQVSRVIGSGSSCSQPLLAKRPSCSLSV